MQSNVAITPLCKVNSNEISMKIDQQSDQFGFFTSTTINCPTEQDMKKMLSSILTLNVMSTRQSRSSVLTLVMLANKLDNKQSTNTNHIPIALFQMNDLKCFPRYNLNYIPVDISISDSTNSPHAFSENTNISIKSVNNMQTFGKLSY